MSHLTVQRRIPRSSPAISARVPAEMPSRSGSGDGGYRPIAFRGRPPLAPFARAAAALAGDVARPACRAGDRQVGVERFPVQPVTQSENLDLSELILGRRFQSLRETRWKAEVAAVRQIDDDAVELGIVTCRRGARLMPACRLAAVRTYKPILAYPGVPPPHANRLHPAPGATRTTCTARARTTPFRTISHVMVCRPLNRVRVQRSDAIAFQVICSASFASSP